MQPKFRRLAPGDPAPWFRADTPGNPRYAFDTTAGRYIVLFFYASAGDPAALSALSAAADARRIFDDQHACLFAVSLDPADRDKRGLTDRVPGFRVIWDFDRAISTAYGAAPIEAVEGAPLQRFWIVLDPGLRVLRLLPFSGKAEETQAMLAYVSSLPTPLQRGNMGAPVLHLSNVFEPDLCADLVSAHEKNGGQESGFMREVDGKTVYLTDHNHKRRSDHALADEAIIRKTKERVLRRIVPEIEKAFQFKVTRMERFIVARYGPEEGGGHFRAHRDNTTKGTAHRRFAVTINLSADFDGGDLSFPEYGPQTYKPPVGGAVVFSCSLLHAVSKVTRGQRYAFLPFLYDEAAARLRMQNNQYLDKGVAAYDMGPERS